MSSQQFFLRSVVRLVVFAAATFGVSGLFAQADVSLTTMAPSALATARDMGPVPDTQQMGLTITVAPGAARRAALDAFLTAATTAGSTSYHQWLTPMQFGAQFGAEQDRIAAVRAWAQAAGLQVAVSPGGMRVMASGTAKQVVAALGVQVDAFQQAGYTFYAPVGAVKLPAGLAGVSGIAGLNNLPGDGKMLAAGAGSTPGTSMNGVASALDIQTLGAVVDANVTPLLALDNTLGATALTQSDLDSFGLLMKQAAAQGMTVLLARAGSSLGFPSGLAEVTVLATAGDAADGSAPFVTRPDWQAVPGIVGDGFRHAPDVTVGLKDFAAALAEIAGGTRLGNINPVLYELAPVAGLYSQAGSWAPATGLGALDLKKLAKVYPRGTGMSYTSFAATLYSPMHGQATSLSSTVTSGTGGGVPTGTVSFVTSAGVVLGTSALTNGSGSITLNTLDSGNYVVDAVYSGDAVYASSTSPTSQLYVAPENTVLAVQVGGMPTIGGTYTVTVTDTAPSGVGQPTGPVTVTISGTNQVYSANLSPAGAGSSSATVTIPATTAGTLTLSVQCTTTQNYACNNPYTTTVTIAKATPVLSISSNPTTLVSGQQVTLNAVVSTVGSAPAPTGSVTFFDNGTTLNAAQLVNGAAQTTGTVPTTATHSLTATYAGDPNYNGVSTTAGSSTSGTITTTLLLQSSASTVTTGQTITFTATLTAASTGPATPTGTVTFFDGGAALGTANIVNNVASFSTAGLSATVNHTITAMYSGDGYYGVSTSNAVGLSSNNTSSSTATMLAISPVNPVHGSTVTLTATVSAVSGTTVPTGTVTFTNANGGPLGTVALVNGVATLQTNQLPGGTSTFTAGYNGSGVYNASFSAAQSVTVTPEPVQLTVTPSANATFGGTITVLVTVTGASGVAYPTGTVTVTPQGSGYSAASSASVTSGGTNSTGSASVLVQAVGAGPVTFTATYSGDKNFAAAGPVSTNVTVAKAASTTTVSFSPTTVVAGQPTIVTAHVGFVSSIAPTGTVQFFSGTQLLGTATLGTNGSASLTTTFAAGNQVVTAVYSGDANYAGSTSAPANTNPGTVASTTVLQITPGTVAVGGSVALAVTVGPAGTPTPTGTVQIVSGTTVICTVALTNGSTGCMYTPPTAGSFALTANYLGDGTFAASSSTPVTLVVTGTVTTGRIATVTTLVATGPAATGGMTTLTATIVPATASSTVLSGTVSFYDGTTLLGTVPVTVATGGTNGTAALAVSLSTTVTHTITAVYSGDTMYAGSTSTAITGITTVTKITPVLTLTVSPTQGLSGSAVVLIAVVSGVTAGNAVPTGTVTFYAVSPAGTTNLGAATLGASGTGAAQAVLSTVGIPAGATSVYAVYGGDGNFSMVTSNVVSVGLQSFSLVFVPQSLTLFAGQTGNATIVVTGSAGFVGNVIFGCTAPAGSGLTCSVSPTTLTGSGQVQLVVGTVAPKARGSEVAARRVEGWAGGMSLAALLCWMMPAGRRRRLTALLVVLFGISLAAGIGCADNSFVYATPTGGTPQGTSVLTIVTAVTNGTQTVRQTYPYTVTVQ